VDEGGDVGGTQALTGDGLDVALQSCERGVEPVANLGFDQAAESLDRVEFRTVGRQR
jgi:hypothetical protein